jgi:hypothetical protein
MDNQELIKIIAAAMYNAALPSRNGLHTPDRYQASVSAEDVGHALERAGLIEKFHMFYSLAMPPQETKEFYGDRLP